MNKINSSKQDYYTDEIRERINGMTNEEMEASLKALEGTHFWFAILKYNLKRVGNVQDSFLTLDPVQEPTKISRYQGTITGILDLQDAVLTLKYDSLHAEDPKKKEEDFKDELGGAYGKGY